MKKQLFISLLFAWHCLAGFTQPSDNPVATYYGNGNYPIWTDNIKWNNVIDMSLYTNGTNDFEKFENARDELFLQGGGVLYYPSGIYDFTDMPADGADGRGLMLKSGIVIRGKEPVSNPNAKDGEMLLGTQFEFGFSTVTDVSGNDAYIPRDWNFIGISNEDEPIKNVNNIGMVWVQTIGATIYFGHERTTSDKWSNINGWQLGGKAVPINGWGERTSVGDHPLDPFNSGTNSETYLGAGSGRLIFGCELIDATVVNRAIDYSKTNNDDFFHTYRFGPRIGAYGSNILVANNRIPKSDKNFIHKQLTCYTWPQQSGCGCESTPAIRNVMFDYAKTTGIDINKQLLGLLTHSSGLEGMLEKNVIVRDNYIYNHGHKGYEISGNFVLLLDNINARDFLYQSQDVYGLDSSWTLTLDGFMMSSPGGNGCISDNLSRAIDMAGGNGWVHGNWFNNTHSDPGNDGEGILWQAHGGMASVQSFAITHNTGTSYMAGYDVTQYGGLWAWNSASGNIGNIKAGNMYDAAIVNNNSGSTVTTGSIPVVTTCPDGIITAPGSVTATVDPTDSNYIEITWADNSDNEIGFRIDKRIDGSAEWQTVVYRPRRDNSQPSPGNLNPQLWRDYMAPRNVPVYYRVVAINCNDEGGTSAINTPVQINPVTVGQDYPEAHTSHLFYAYPNPVDNTLYIEVNEANARYSITNTQGTKILQGTLQAGVNAIQTEMLTAGIYLLQIESQQIRQQQKLIKQ